MVLILDNYKTLSDALRQFQEMGEPISALNDLGAVALLRADGSRIVTLGIFSEGWQVSLSAPSTERKLATVGKRLVAAIGAEY